MLIIGCDYHPSWQQICWMDTETGETEERKLEHASGEAERFYRGLAGPALIGMESTGNCQWFVEMTRAAGHDVWVGDAAKIRASDPRQQKHDRRDAALLLRLLLDGRFPRIWTPSGEEKDLRQLLIHRYKLVRMRAQVKNELQHLAMNQGVMRKRKLWSKAGEKVLLALPLHPWASRRREDLMRVKEMLNGQIDLLDQAVKEAAEKNDRARLLMTQPGVGSVTSLAFVLTMGDVSRFPRGKHVASYLGLIPREYSSGGKQRLGSISKQGNRFMRMLLVEAAQVAVRIDPQMRNEYLHRCRSKAKGVAKVAAARKLAIRLYWMLRTSTGYPEVVRVESSSRVPLVSAS
ncbi:MAG TPA: IS110 family transposase [Candidatus Acidoferrales bacterium]|nr:IS110 family transposase [Candidatus Acidoferrales bacterium]